MDSRSKGVTQRANPAPKTRGIGAPDLSHDVDAFIEQLTRKYAKRLSNRPQAFKKRVLRLIAFQLPPRPRPAGRPQQARISLAASLYQQQCEEVRQEMKPHQVNWLPIAQQCIPGFRRIKDGPRRRTAIQTLRNSVYARLKRIKLEKKPHGSSHTRIPRAY